jgi:prevent-host-death family protein
MTATTHDSQHDSHWQVQEAKQRFSELLRSVQSEGPQFVTKHGEEIAVVIDIEEYRRLHPASQTRSFKEWLLGGPEWDDEFIELVNERPKEYASDEDLAMFEDWD